MNKNNCDYVLRSTQSTYLRSNKYYSIALGVCLVQYYVVVVLVVGEVGEVSSVSMEKNRSNARSALLPHPLLINFVVVSISRHWYPVNEYMEMKRSTAEHHSHTNFPSQHGPIVFLSISSNASFLFSFLPPSSCACLFLHHDTKKKLFFFFPHLVCLAAVCCMESILLLRPSNAKNRLLLLPP
jgi:hypothetical protein